MIIEQDAKKLKKKSRFFMLIQKILEKFIAEEANFR